jgi:hypothetical protein
MYKNSLLACKCTKISLNNICSMTQVIPRYMIIILLKNYIQNYLKSNIKKNRGFRVAPYRMN